MSFWKYFALTFYNDLEGSKAGFAIFPIQEWNRHSHKVMSDNVFLAMLFKDFTTASSWAFSNLSKWYDFRHILRNVFLKIVILSYIHSMSWYISSYCHDHKSPYHQNVRISQHHLSFYFELVRTTFRFTIDNSDYTTFPIRILVGYISPSLQNAAQIESFRSNVHRCKKRSRRRASSRRLRRVRRVCGCTATSNMWVVANTRSSANRARAPTLQ